MRVQVLNPRGWVYVGLIETKNTATERGLIL